MWTNIHAVGMTELITNCCRVSEKIFWRFERILASIRHNWMFKRRSNQFSSMWKSARMACDGRWALQAGHRAQLHNYCTTTITDSVEVHRRRERQNRSIQLFTDVRYRNSVCLAGKTPEKIRSAPEFSLICTSTCQSSNSALPRGFGKQIHQPRARLEV